MENTNDRMSASNIFLVSLFWPLLIVFICIQHLMPHRSDRLRDIENRLKKANLLGERDPNVRFLVDD